MEKAFLFIFVRRLVQDFLALFRFTEADTYALLSANGIYAFRGSSPAEQSPERAKANERTLGGSRPLNARVWGHCRRFPGGRQSPGAGEPKERPGKNKAAPRTPRLQRTAALPTAGKEIFSVDGPSSPMPRAKIPRKRQSSVFGH